MTASPLVDPVQMDDICLLKFGEGSDVPPVLAISTAIILLETVGFPDDDAFPHEFPCGSQLRFRPTTLDLVCLFVTYQHFRLDAVVLKRFHQSSGSDSRTTYSFGSIDD